MPRYAFAPAEVAALQRHLERIGDEQRIGVGADRILVGLPALSGRPDLIDDLASAIRTGLAGGLGGGAVWGRNVEIAVVSRGVLPEEVFAVVSPLGTDVAVQAVAGVPSLLLLGALGGDEDPTIVRAAGPSREGVRAGVAQGLAQAAPPSVTILDGSDGRGDAEALALALRLEAPDMAGRIRLSLPAAGAPIEDGAALVLLSAARLDAGRSWPGPVWLSWDALRALGGVPDGGEVVAVIETPWIVSRAIETGRHPVLVHGERAGAALAAALKAAGRDLTRARLVSALDEQTLAEWGLDYATHPLTGTDDVLLLTLPDG